MAGAVFVMGVDSILKNKMNQTGRKFDNSVK